VAGFHIVRDRRGGVIADKACPHLPHHGERGDEDQRRERLHEGARQDIRHAEVAQRRRHGQCQGEQCRDADSPRHQRLAKCPRDREQSFRTRDQMAGSKVDGADQPDGEDGGDQHFAHRIEFRVEHERQQDRAKHKDDQR